RPLRIKSFSEKAFRLRDWCWTKKDVVLKALESRLAGPPGIKGENRPLSPTAPGNFGSTTSNRGNCTFRLKRLGTLRPHKPCKWLRGWKSSDSHWNRLPPSVAV